MTLCAFLLPLKCPVPERTDGLHYALQYPIRALKFKTAYCVVLLWCMYAVKLDQFLLSRCIGHILKMCKIFFLKFFPQFISGTTSLTSWCSGGMGASEQVFNRNVLHLRRNLKHSTLYKV